MGSLFGGGGDVQAPDYSAQIQALKDAAAKSATLGQFKPVTVTTSFGTPQYTYDTSGQLTGASYTAAPWLQSLQQGSQNLASGYQAQQARALADLQGLQTAQQAYGATGGLYSAAQQALPTSYDTTQATQDYYNQMQALVAPEREQALAKTRQGLFNTGRQGLAIGATQAGGQLATNPEMAAYYNAIAKQDATNALNAKSQALADLQARTSMAQGLYGTAGAQGTLGGSIQNQYYQNLAASQVPTTVNLANLGTMEGYAQQPLTLGQSLGTSAMGGGQYAGNMLYQGAQGAADLGAAQERARVAAANANAQQGSFWDALGGMALTAGMGALTGGAGLGLGAAGGGLFGAGTNIFSGSGMAGNIAGGLAGLFGQGGGQGSVQGNADYIYDL